MPHQRTIATSLDALRRKIGVEALAHLQPILLLQVLIALSQSLNGSIAQPEALARTLLLNGQQRLRGLLNAAPRLNLPVDQLLAICRSGDPGDAERTPEERAVQALLEVCVGLMLQSLREGSRRPHIPVLLRGWQRVLSSDILSLSSFSVLLSWPPRARAHPIPLSA